jgi:hypothetical protein
MNRVSQAFSSTSFDIWKGVRRYCKTLAGVSRIRGSLRKITKRKGKCSAPTTAKGLSLDGGTRRLVQTV